MKSKLNTSAIRKSLLDIRSFVGIDDNHQLVITDMTKIQDIAHLIMRDTKYVFLFGMNEVLKTHHLSVKDEHIAEIARRFYEQLFKTVMEKIDVQSFNVTDDEYAYINRIDVDGFNLNQEHTPNEYAEPREYATTKCLHFDGATPFIANIYGPTENIQGGFPVIADTANFCKTYNISPKNLVENIPESYNAVIKEKYYSQILEEFSFALAIDTENDIVLSMACNEILYGIAHGATKPYKKNNSQSAARPIRHLEFQHDDVEKYQKWYAHYKLNMDKAKNVVDNGENLNLNYHQKKIIPIPIFKLEDLL